MSEKRFEGRVVLITGAAGGFGRDTARRFAGQGARLVLSDLNRAGLDELAQELEAAGSTHICEAGDIAREETSARLVGLAKERFGGLDVAINNAGLGQDYHRLPDIPSDVARRIIDIDLMSVFYGMKHQLPELSKGWERDGRQRAILNIASVAGLGAAPKLSVYAAAKHGVVGFTRSAALEYARRGVRVNALCPAFARTDMVTKGYEPGDAEAEAQIVRGIPMRRLAEPGEVTQAILWACDPDNSFMTGETIAIDGGLAAM